VLFASLSATKKFRFIYIQKELDKAKIITVVSVNKYTDSSMLCYAMNDTFNLKYSPRPVSILLPAMENTLNEEVLEKKLAGQWPAIGQKVLLVIDSSDRIKLFAVQIKDQYRFWDPNSVPFSNSIFFYPKNSAYRSLNVCLQFIDEKSDYLTCEDGCLVDIGVVNERQIRR
jgi:hypothetical protein